jgi:glycosyltransferase involved in cell wall biosynthesis
VGARGWRDGALHARIERSPVRSRIRLAGHVSDDELVALYQGATCFLFPSRYEGFGLPALEAMACGAPVVASSATSIPEVVGDAGILVDPDDYEAWAQTLAEVLSEPATRADLSARGRERASGFTWEACAEQTVSAYRKALS